jgi:hypothetical protein
VMLMVMVMVMVVVRHRIRGRVQMPRVVCYESSRSLLWRCLERTVACRRGIGFCWAWG